jgi:hypothetical protein
MNPTLLPATAIAHMTIGYCRTREHFSYLSSAFLRGANAVILSTSISPRRSALLTAGGRSFARADLSAMQKSKNTVLSSSETRLTVTSYLDLRALPFHKGRQTTTNWSRCWDSHLVAHRTRRTSETGYLHKDLTVSPVTSVTRSLRTITSP